MSDIGKRVILMIDDAGAGLSSKKYKGTVIDENDDIIKLLIDGPQGYVATINKNYIITYWWLNDGNKGDAKYETRKDSSRSY